MNAIHTPLEVVAIRLAATLVVPLSEGCSVGIVFKYAVHSSYLPLQLWVSLVDQPTVTPSTVFWKFADRYVPLLIGEKYLADT